MGSQMQLDLLSSNGNKPLTLKTWPSGFGISAGSSSSTIPYYNILWADFANNAITIDYVSDPSKSSVKLEKQSWPVSSEDQHAACREFVANVRQWAYGSAKPQKRAYVLINPNSGPGGALKKYLRDVKPLFEAARMQLEEVTLSKGGEATDLVEKMDLDKYDTVIACSGDGTPHEIFNGLGKRPDAGTALKKIAVSHIPCGSGNGLSLNLYGTNKLGPAAVGIIKGSVMPVDLVSITQGPRRILSFLTQSLGVIAESDLATEHLRWMGSKRFEVGLIQRLYEKRCYPCDLVVKVEVPDKDGVKAHYAERVSQMNGAESGVATNGTESSKSGEPQGLPPLQYGTIQDDSSTLQGWEMIPSDRINNFYCGNMAWVSADANFFPGALPSDGCMDLIVMNNNSIFKSVKAYMSVESGKFFDLPEVMYKKISAYRILPRDQDGGYISVDGERVPFEPFQAEIHQGLGRVISKNGKLYEAQGPRGWGKVIPKQPTANTPETAKQTNGEASSGVANGQER